MVSEVSFTTFWGVIRSIKVVSVFCFGDRKCHFLDIAIGAILRKKHQPYFFPYVVNDLVLSLFSYHATWTKMRALNTKVLGNPKSKLHKIHLLKVVIDKTAQIFKKLPPNLMIRQFEFLFTMTLVFDY